MINNGFQRGFSLLGGHTCKGRRWGGKKSGETHCPFNRPGINKRDGLSVLRLQIMLVIFAVHFFLQSLSKSAASYTLSLSLLLLVVPFPPIHCALLRSLFNKVDFQILCLCTCFTPPHPNAPHHHLPPPSLFHPPCEVNSVAVAQPTSPSPFTVGVSTQRFKICPFIWAAQAGKWKGCQSLEPWESAWLNRQCQKRREGTKRANTLHTVIDFSVTERCRKAK